MNNNSLFINIKKMLKKNYVGRVIINFHHYCIAIPTVWIGSMRYYLIKNKIKPVSFYSIDDTFSMLISDKKSLCRFGDGEISWIYRDSKGYFGQDNSEELSIRLKEVINNKDKSILIGIPDFFGSMKYYSKKRIRSRNAHLAKYYKRWMEMIGDNDVYVDALITRVYNGRKIEDVEFLFKKWKNVWKNKKIIIIEGNQTRFGVGNDLLDNSKSIRRIIAPAENAFTSYDKLWEVTKEHIDPEVIFLIALGPTATVLSYDIGIAGGQAIDIGHLDIEYEWYLSGATKKKPILGKYVNEAGGVFQSDLPNEVLKKYYSEIITKLK